MRSVSTEYEIRTGRRPVSTQSSVSVLRAVVDHVLPSGAVTADEAG